MSQIPEGNRAQGQGQIVHLADCRHLEVNRVTDVSSFDESVVLLETACGTMTIEGEGLHITRLELEKGELALDGKVTGIFYTDGAPKSKGGFFSRFGK